MVDQAWGANFRSWSLFGCRVVKHQGLWSQSPFCHIYKGGILVTTCSFFPPFSLFSSLFSNYPDLSHLANLWILILISLQQELLSCSTHLAIFNQHQAPMRQFPPIHFMLCLHHLSLHHPMPTFTPSPSTIVLPQLSLAIFNKVQITQDGLLQMFRSKYHLSA